MTSNKPNLYGLSKEIQGDRQPPKDIIHMLLFFGYIVKVGGRYFQRTHKKPPAIELDAFQYVTELLPPTSSIQLITITLTHLKSRILQKNSLDRKRATVIEEKRIE